MGYRLFWSRRSCAERFCAGRSRTESVGRDEYLDLQPVQQCSLRSLRLRDLRARNRLIVHRVGRTGIPEEVLWTSRVFGNFIFIILFIFLFFSRQTIVRRANRRNASVRCFQTVRDNHHAVCWFYRGKMFRIVFIARSTITPSSKTRFLYRVLRSVFRLQMCYASGPLLIVYLFINQRLLGCKRVGWTVVLFSSRLWTGSNIYTHACNSNLVTGWKLTGSLT